WRASPKRFVRHSPEEEPELQPRRAGAPPCRLSYCLRATHSRSTAAAKKGRGGAMRKSIIVTAIIAALSLAAPAPALALDKLRVGKAIALPFDFAPVDIGVANGFFQKHGLELEIVAFAGSAKLQQGLAADAIDIGLGSGPELAFVAKGNPVLGICAF